MSDAQRAGRWYVLIVVGWLATNLVWLGRDQRPPILDAAEHATVALDIATALTTRSWSDFVSCALHSPPYPPLVHLVCASAAWFYRDADSLIFWMDVVFGVLLSWSLWEIGRLVERPLVSVGALLLTLCHWLTGVTSRSFLLDFPLAAMVICAGWRILALDRHRTPLNVGILGIVLGLGLLTKGSFVLYVAPALIWLLYRKFRSRVSGKGWWLATMLLIFVALAVAGWWYALRWNELMAYTKFTYWQAVYQEHDPPAWLPDGWIFYAIKVYVPLVPRLAWFAGTALLLWRGPYLGRMLAGWVAIGYGLLTVTANKDLRYFLPLVPLISLASCWGLAQIRARRWRSTVMVATVLWYVAQLAVLSSYRADQWWRRQSAWSSGVITQIISSVFQFGSTHILYPAAALPKPDESAVNWIMERVVEKAQPRVVQILVAAHDPFHNRSTLIEVTQLPRGPQLRYADAPDNRTP